MGQRPSSWRMSCAGTLRLYRTRAVMAEQRMVEKVTARVRARIDEGASRVRVGEGRVALDR
jgi:hypothetical protein